HEAADDERNQRRQDRHEHPAGAARVGGEPGRRGQRGAGVLFAGQDLGLSFLVEGAHAGAPAVLDVPTGAAWPVIAMPSSSSLASGGNSPMIRPPQITRIRSASDRTSSYSSETRRIARPL